MLVVGRHHDLSGGAQTNKMDPEHAEPKDASFNYSAFTFDVMLITFLFELRFSLNLVKTCKTLYNTFQNQNEYFWYLIAERYRLAQKIAGSRALRNKSQEGVEEMNVPKPSDFPTWKELCQHRYKAWLFCVICHVEHRGRPNPKPHTGELRTRYYSIGRGRPRQSGQDKEWSCCRKEQDAKYCSTCHIHTEPCFIDYN